MNKPILAHLNHLAAKANKSHPDIWVNYKPLSPFKTNKIKRIDEATKHPLLTNSLNLSKLLNKNSNEDI